MIISRAEKLSQFFWWSFIPLPAGWAQGVCSSQFYAGRKLTGKDKTRAGYQSIHTHQLTHQSCHNRGSEPNLGNAGPPWITGRSRNSAAKTSLILFLRACFTSDSEKKIWLKGLQNTSESAFSHSSIRWMEDDHELSDCGSAHALGRNRGSTEGRRPESMLSYCHKEHGSGDATQFLQRRCCRWTWSIKLPDGVAAVTFAGEAAETRAVWGTIWAERQDMQVMAMLQNTESMVSGGFAVKRRTSSFTTVSRAVLNVCIAVGRWAVCVRQGHSELTDGEWQCYAELLRGGLQWC